MLSLDWNCVFVQHQLDLTFQEWLHFFPIGTLSKVQRIASALTKHLFFLPSPPPFNKKQTACAKGPRPSPTIHALEFSGTLRFFSQNLSANSVNRTQRAAHGPWITEGSRLAVRQIQLPHALVSEDKGQKTSV